MSIRQTVLQFANASYAYAGVRAVERVTLAMHAGDFMAVVGPNGSGKSTLIKLALGLFKPSEGSVRLFGKDPQEFDDWHRVGYVPQVAAGIQQRFPATVAEIVSHGQYNGLSLTRFWKRSATPEVLAALEAAGVAHLVGRRIGDLSVGQQQRVLVARALVREPELLVLDEPVAGIDARGEELLNDLLERLNRENGISILIVSHDIGAVMRQANTVACINRSLVFHGEPHDLTQEELGKLYGFPVEVLLHDALHEHR
ncbi:MAG: metal ABC transporter ATP-binding protein [Chloroflexi bacterium]|nr:metal ABC transporter ATP-binding protein [Chloroflexota bacterium]